jgi:hypothetical protein
MISDRTRLENSVGIASVERRKHPRYAFTAAADVIETRSGARVQGRISDLAKGGCYVDAMSPFAVGAEVKVRIAVEGGTFVAEARVVFAAAGMGMGLMFTTIEPEQLTTLERWIAELSGEVRPEPPSHKPQKITEDAMVSNTPRREQNYVLNELIIALMRKNVLSDTEGKALLQKLLQ